jgi:hypothetical protein
VTDPDQAAAALAFAKKYELLPASAVSNIRTAVVDYSDAEELAAAIPRWGGGGGGEGGGPGEGGGLLGEGGLTRGRGFDPGGRGDVCVGREGGMVCVCVWGGGNTGGGLEVTQVLLSRA